jgi:hypothetical protein
VKKYYRGFDWREDCVEEKPSSGKKAQSTKERADVPAVPPSADPDTSRGDTNQNI